MSKLSKTISSLQKLDELAGGDGFLCKIHPLAKFVLTLLFLVLVVSFRSGNLSGLAGMGIYLFILYEIGNISLKDALYRLRIILPLVCLIGIFNPFFDRKTVFFLGSFAITSGMISMLSLILKGLYTVLASYALIASTTMEGICYAMRMLHVPKIIVTEFMLIYRYVGLLLREADLITQSYYLRAPGQKGINIRAWGPLVGLMLLRCLERAETIYKSMCLRGFKSEFYYKKALGYDSKDLVFFVLMAGVAIILRFFPLLETLGRIIVR